MLVGLVAFSFACDAFSLVSGHVYDANGQSISGATVVLEMVNNGEHNEIYSREQLTNEAGRFALQLSHGPTNVALRLSVSKDGYKPFVKELKASDVVEMRDKGYELRVVLDDDIH